MAGFQTGSSSFALDLSRFAKKANVDMRLVVRKLAFESFKRIILRTPVDTGRARANWGVTIGQPRTGFTVEGFDKGGGATMAAAQAAVQQFDCNGSIFITNNVPYIGPLEYGSSTQAPAGMVRVTVEEMTGFLNKANIGSLKQQTGGNE